MLYRRDLVRASLVAVHISPVSSVFLYDSLLNTFHIRSETWELATMSGGRGMQESKSPHLFFLATELGFTSVDTWTLRAAGTGV